MRCAVVFTLFVALVAALAPACSGGGGAEDGFRLVLEGRADVAGEELDEGEHTVAAGDEVRMTAGSAVLELPGARTVLLRAGDEREGSVVAVSDRPDVVAGDAVVVADEPTTFTAGAVEVVVREGAARVQRGLSVTIGMYEGDAEVRAAGRAFDGGLRALRQLSVPATGVLPREAVPLVYDEVDTDPWDLRFIGDAIDLGRTLDVRSSGYTGQLGPGARVDARLLRFALPDLDDVPAVAVTDRTPGEALVGSAIALEAGGDDRIPSVFSFRDAGAKWGLVALDHRVARDRVLDRIDGAIGRSPLLFAVEPDADVESGPTTTAPAPGGAVSVPPPADASPPATPGADPDPDPDPTVLPPTSPDVTAPPSIDLPLLPDADDPVPLEGPITEILDTTGEILGSVIDALLPDAGDRR